MAVTSAEGRLRAYVQQIERALKAANRSVHNAWRKEAARRDKAEATLIALEVRDAARP